MGMRQLTSLDASFLAIESTRTYGHVGALVICDPATAPGGEVGVADIAALLADRLHLVPPFRWKLVEVPLSLDYPYWIEDPEFDLQFHVRESAVPPPGDPHRLAETVARIFARPLDRARPLWELYLIQGVEGGRFALLTKTHHAAIDGVSGEEILGVLFDSTPTGREIPPPPAPSAAEQRPSDLEMLARGLLGVPRQSLRALRSLPPAARNVGSLPGVSAMPGAPSLAGGMARLRRLRGGEEDDAMLEVTTARAPKTSFNGPISPHRRFAYGSLPLAPVKALKRELGLTVNDVVVYLCVTALREWMAERGEQPDGPLVAMIPVSVRTEEQRGTFGNRVSAMTVPLPTDEPDPLTRARRTHDVLRSAKERHRALPADLMTDMANFIPSSLQALASRTTVRFAGRMRPLVNLVISNVPGSQEPLYCAGARVEAFYPVSVVVDGVGLNITVMSYEGRLHFGLIADRDQIDDLWSLLDRLGRALRELETIALGPAQGVPG
jgi:diacylglycerol O-acyltransferase / wax synthase